MYQCARSLVEAGPTSMLLPYFFRFLDRGEFPNGAGMLYQPVALVKAMEVFCGYFKKYENDYRELLHKQIQA